MTKLRGGLGALSEGLQGKIWRSVFILPGSQQQRLIPFRAEISGCVSTLSSPRFDNIDLLDLSFPLPLQDCMPQLTHGLKKIAADHCFGVDFVSTLLELQYFTTALNKSPLNFLLINRFSTSIYCYLISPQSSMTEASGDSNLEEMCRTAALLYLKTIYDFHLCLRLPGPSMGATIDNGMIQEVKTCLSTVAMDTMDSKNLVLWLLFLGGAVLGSTKDRAWFVARLARAIMEFQICGFDDAKTRVEEFWWVERIHQEPCRLLWDEAMVTVDVMFGSND
jgi:hypothetical protein